VVWYFISCNNTRIGDFLDVDAGRFIAEEKV